MTTIVEMDQMEMMVREIIIIATPILKIAVNV